MHKSSSAAAIVRLLAIASAMAVLGGCAGLTGEESPEAPKAVHTFTDPFAYCAAVGTIDAPDARYIGPQVTEPMVRGIRQVFEVPAEVPDTGLYGSAVWRCMDGKVYACLRGANLPCDGKADAGRTPKAAMKVFCRNNPDADYIPFAATGRTTIYQWRCDGEMPAIAGEFTRPDARGFLANLWHEIPRPE